MPSEAMEEGRLIVISPHLDDAVLGCGGLLADRPGATVITVFAGIPRDPSQLTKWDAACGFASAGEAMAVRRSEDSAALEILGAQPQWLDHLDEQYGEDEPAGDPVEAIAHSLRRAIAEADPTHEALLLLPLGLFHRDHDRVHLAVRRLLAVEPGRAGYAYEDALYRRLPGLVQQRLAELAEADIAATPVAPPGGSADAKRLAIDCYPSQRRGLAAAGWPDDFGPPTAEAYWALSPRRPQTCR